MQAKIDAAKAKEAPTPHTDSTPAPVTRTLTPAEKRAQQKFKLKAPEPKAKGGPPPEEQAVIDRVKAERDAYVAQRKQIFADIKEKGLPAGRRSECDAQGEQGHAGCAP